MRLYYLLLFLCFCTNGLGHTISNNVCSRYCKASKNVFSYNVGSSYIYQYIGSVNSVVQSNKSHQNDAPSFSADLEITVLSPCDFQLQVTDVRTQFGNVGHDFDNAITQNPIRFSFQNGKIDAVCSSTKDSIPIVNIKKGIISAFQNNMYNVDTEEIIFETDISGICETRYEVLESNSKIRKTKDLTRCNKRSRKYNSWQSEIYNNNQARFSSPLLKSTQNCIQTYQENILHTVECEEKHLFRPFSDGENGVVTTLYQALKFMKKISTKTETNTHDFKYTSLVYENNQINSVEPFDLVKIENVLDDLEANTRNGIDADVPGQFSLLASLMEGADKGSLFQLFETIRASNRKKKFFVDSISLITTVDGIEVMKKLYEEKEISSDLFNGWVTSLAFIKDPSKNIIHTLSGLLDFDHYTKQKVYLAVSSVIYQFCKVNKNCEEDEDVLNIFQKILKPIEYKCTPNNPKSQEDILITLKSIGNSGEPYFAPFLRKCYMSDDVPIEIKVASIQAHRRMNCDNNKNLDDLGKIFANTLENTEVRISAYLAIMQCSSYSTFEEVKSVLNDEQTNQVGSFVWSHLTNLQETSIFWKQDLKRLLENELLKNKFNSDAIKHSRNYELSTFFDAIDTGVGVESNVIFTPESYIPKSAMLNFTIDVFGETVNLLEFGARVEGFEDIVENFFGPNGYFPEKSITSFLETQRRDHEDSQKDSKNTNVLQRDPSGLLYAKVFGNEISSIKFKDVDEILGKPTSVKSLFDAALTFVRKSDIDYTKSLKFVDTSYKIPTILGFPLELSVNGTATLGLVIKGSIDTKNLLNYKFNIAGKMYPSTSVEVVGKISVDAYFTKIGLKSISSLNSNTYLDGHIEIDHGKLVDIKVNLPKTKMDIINIKSDVFYIRNDETIKLPDITTDGTYRTDCTQEHFKQITGLRLCHNIKYVNASSIKEAPYFPLTGSFKYSIDVQKVDTFDDYQLKWLYETENNTQYRFSFYLDTPNSKIDRKLSANLSLDLSEKNLDMKIASPFMSFDLFGSIELKKDNVDVILKQSFNNKSIIDLDAVIKYVNPTYELDFNLIYKSNKILWTKGFVTLTPTEIESHFMVKFMQEHFTIFKATAKLEDDKYTLNSDIVDGLTDKIKGTLRSQLLSTSGLLSLTAKCVYEANNKQESVSLDFNATKVNKIDQNRYLVYFNLTSTQEPKYNTLLDLQSHRANLHYDLIGVLKIFGKEWNTRQMIKYLKDYDLTDVGLISSFTCLQKNIDYKIILSYNKSSTVNVIHGLAQLNKIQRIEALYSYKLTGSNGGINILFYYPKTSYSIKGEITKIDAEEYSLKLIGEKEVVDVRNVFFEVNGFYNNSTKDKLQNYSLHGKIDLSSIVQLVETPWNFKTLIQKSNDIVTSLSEIKINKNVILSKLSWTKDSFHNDLEYNDRTIFFINCHYRSRRIDLQIALNIYQHFELGITFQPYTKIEMDFFWDKGGNYNHKFYLNLENSGSGLYSMALQYPNQKVLASFTLQSTQIILNVTWGLEIYQKIYLNLGSKVYDLGGIWYGELETPFKYLEKQHINIKYLILQNSIEVEVEVYWRDHRIDFVVSGSRSPTHVKGKVEMTTTLQEVYKVAIGVSHTLNPNVLEKVTNVSIIFNQHHITGFNKWSKDGININSNFEVSSPSKSIKPIILKLEMTSDETASNMNSVLSWQEKEISISYKVENSMSFILIKTPFKGIERTKLQYALIRTQIDMRMEIEIDVLNQLNHILLQWFNENNNTYNVEFVIISPMTGTYQLFFKHSTKHGYLLESLIVNHGKENNTILGIEVNGNVVSIWDVDLTHSVRFLEHNAIVKIKNTAKPYTSKIEVMWDKLIVRSNVEVLFTHDELERIYCLVNSSVLPEPFEIQYSTSDDYYLKIQMPNGYTIQNNLELQYPQKIEDNFVFKTPNTHGKLNFKHDFDNGTLKEYLRIALNEQILSIRGETKYQQSNSIFDIIQFININVNTSWNDQFKLNYTKAIRSSTTDTFFEPLLIIDYNNKTLEIKSNSNITPTSFVGNMLIKGSHITTISIKGQYNVVDKNVDIRIDSENIEGHISFNSNEDIVLVNIKSKINFSLQGIMNLAAPNMKAPSESRLLLKIQMDNHRPFELYFNSEIPDWENVNVRLIQYNSSTNGMLTIKKNEQVVIFKYHFKQIHYSVADFDINVTSSIDYLNNSYLRMYFNIIDKNLSLKTKFSKYESEFINLFNSNDIQTNDLQSYDRKLKMLILLKSNNSEIINISFDTKTNFTQKENSLSFTFCVVSNQSKLDVILSKQDRSALILNISSIFDNKLYANTNFNYKHSEHTLKISSETESTFGNFNSNILISHNTSGTLHAVSIIEYIRNGDVYYANVSTKYHNIIWSESQIELKSPSELYNGDLKIHLGSRSNTFFVLLNSSESYNKINCVLNVYTIRKINGILDFQLDFFETTSNKITLDYDFESENKRLALNYLPDLQNIELIKVDIKLNKSDTSIAIEFPHNKKYFYLNGKNSIQDQEVNVLYNIHYLNYVMKIDFFYINKNFTQAKFEMNTNIKGWESLIIENRIDDYKIRIFMYSRYHKFSLIADKTAVDDQEKDLFTITYNDEPLVNIRSGKDQIFLMTSSMYINYKLGVQYVPDPRIYAFSILKNGENLMSFVLQNKSNFESMQLRGKLIAPILFTNYPDITFNLNANYQISKSLQFALTSANKNLFEIKWFSKLENSLYEAYFKYSSEINLLKLKLFEIHPSLNMWSDLKCKINFIEENTMGYFTELVIPFKQLDMKFILEFPCKSYQCNYNFYANKTFVDVHWDLPIENLNKIKLIADFNNINTLNNSIGNIILEANQDLIEYGWDIAFGNNSFLIYMKSNVNTTIHNREIRYKYLPYKEILLNVELDELTTTLRFNNNSITQSGQFCIESNSNKILYTGLMSDKHLNLTISNNLGTKDIFISKDTNQSATMLDFYMSTEMSSNYSKNITEEGTIISLMMTMTSFITSSLLPNKIKSKIVLDQEDEVKFDFNTTVLNTKETMYNLLFRYNHSNSKLVVLGPDTKYNVYYNQNVFSVEHNTEKLVYFKYLLESNSTDIQALVDIEYININFSLKYLNQGSDKNLQIKLPSFFNQYILYDLNVSSIDDTYLLENKITLSQNKTIFVRSKASFLVTFANLHVYVTSPYSEDFNSNVMYDANKNHINLAISSSLGQKNITATCVITPKKELSIILRTPFIGYTSMALEAKFDKANKKAYFKLFKEEHALILDGTITNTSNDIYELNMSAKTESSNESFAFIYIKLDKRVMKFNANFNWNSKTVILGLDYDPKNLLLQLDSSIEQIKSLKLSGVYLKSNNTYKLEGNGQWDSTNIIFFGNISFEPNDFNLKSEIIIGDNHQGKIDISIQRNETLRRFKFFGYFPKPLSNIHITLQSHKGNVNREELLLKTPFKNFKNISVSLITSNKALEVKSYVDIGLTTISTELTALKRDSAVDIQAYVALPNSKYSTEVSLDVMSSFIKTDNVFLQYDFRNTFLVKIYLSVYQNVVFEIVHKNAKGEIYGQYAKSEMNASYMIMDYFNLNTKHPYADLNLQISRNNFKFNLRNSSVIHYEIIYLNNPEKVQVGFMQRNAIYNIELNKNLNRFVLELQKLLSFSYEKNYNQFNLLVKAQDYITAEFNTTKTLINFCIISSKLDSITISGTLQRGKLFGRTVFKFERRNENLVHFNEFHDSKQVNISFDFKNKLNLVLTHEYKHSKLFIDIQNIDHEISYEFSDLGAIKLLFKSHTIPNNGFVLQGTAISPLNLRFSINSVDNNIVYIKLLTNIDKNSFYIDFQAPQNDILSYINFETIWGNSIFKTLNKIEVISSKLGNVSAIGNFDLTTDGLDVVTHLRLPFLDNFEFFDAEVHIHKNITPWFIIRLPNNNTYSANVLYLNNDNLFRIDLGYICAEKIYGLNITYNKDNSFVSGEVLSPYEGYQHFAVLLKKERNSIHGEFNINERIYNANISHMFDDDRQWILANLTTSFAAFENYYFEIDHGDNFFHCFLNYPNLKRPVGFGFDNRFKMGIYYKLSLLYPVLEFDYALFEVNAVPDGAMLIVKAVSQLNDNFINVDLKVNKLQTLRYIDISLKTKNHTIEIKSNMTYENYMRYNKNYIYNIMLDDALDLYIDLFFRQIYCGLDVSSKHLNLKLNISNPRISNNHYGGHFVFDKLSNNYSIGLYLPHKVINLDQKYCYNSTDFFYMTRISWNNKPIGLAWHLSKTKEPKLINIHFELDLELPVRRFQFDHNFKLFMNNLEPITTEIASKLQWDKNDNATIAWHAVFSNRYVKSIISSGILDHDVILHIEFSKLSEMPFRLMLEIEYSAMIEKRVHIELFYNKTIMNDVMIDERKFIISQPFSRLNHTTIWRTSRCDKYTNITVLLHYTDFVAKAPEFIKASLEIGNEEFEISGLVENKKNSLSIHSKSQTNLYSKGLNIQLKINDNEPLTLDYLYTFKEPTPSFKLVTGYGSYRNYDFFMGIPTKKEITVKLVHNIYGKEFTDGLLTLKLNTTSLLWVKMLWKTNLLNQFHNTIINEYTDIKFVVQSIGRQLIDVMSDNTAKELLKEFQSVRKNVCYYIEQETKKIKNDLGFFWTDIQAACSNNTLYCKDIMHLKSQWSNIMYKNITEPFFDVVYNFCHNLIKIANKTFENIAFALDEIEKTMCEIEDIQKLKENAKLALNNALEEAKKSIKTMKETASTLLQDFESYIFAVKKDVDDLLKPAFNLIDEFWAYFEHQLTYVQIIVLETMDLIQTYTLNLRETKELLQIYNGITLSINSINLLDLLNSVWNVIEVIASNVITNIKDVCDDYTPHVEFAGYQQLLFQSHFDDIKGIMKLSYEKIVWFWKHHQMTENIKNYLMTRWSSFVNVMVINCIGNTEEGLGIFDYIYKPEVGLIEISQRLPVEWESFDKSPAFEQHPLYNHIFQKISSFAANRFEVFIAKLKTSIYTILNIKIRPPTDNFAMIIGNGHFVTFNNKHFDFRGDCSYVLLSDLEKKTFSVVLNYDQSKKMQSLTVVSHENSATVALFEDLRVVLNTENVDLPISTHNLYITKEDDNMIIDNNEGLRIICNFHYNLCTFEVSEWLFGKVGGLLGTLDNEPSTDMTTPEGLRVESIEGLANSWKESKCDVNRTEMVIAKPYIPVMVHTLINSTCSEIFLENNSTMSPCFSIINAKPFYEMCIKDVRRNFEANVCSSVAAYKSQCSDRHVTVHMPAFCVSCSLDKQIEFEEKIFDVNNPKTVDIVFIQELGCLDNTFRNLPNKLNDALGAAEFVNNRFAIVVYGGIAKPAVNTINGSVWTKSPPTIFTPKISYRQGKYTAEDAIKFATKLQFRAAVRKLFVLVQCHVCKDLPHSPELFNALGERDINLHIIKPNPFGEEPILAIDSTNKMIDNGGVLKNDTPNERIIDNLQDMCCGLALSTAGTIAKSSIFDNYTEKWAALVASTTKSCSCQKCKCVQNSNGVGKIECMRCMSPLVKQLLNEYESQHLRT